LGLKGSPVFWMRLCAVLTLALVVVSWNLAVRTCYPIEWDRVWFGMSGSEVWKLCGQPTISSGGMKPDYWEKPFLFGKWQFNVYCGDVLGGQPAPVSDISLNYELPPWPRIKIKYSATAPHILDHEAYDRAFGFRDNATAAPRNPQ